jgi:hypothetical protein
LAGASVLELDGAALAKLEAQTVAALAARPDDPALLLDLAALAVAGNRAVAAEAATRRALALQPGLARGWISLAAALRAQDRTDEAVQAAARAAELSPGSGDAHQAMGVALARAGRHDQAAQAYREALRREPGHASAEFNLALTLLLLGDYEAGFRHYEARFRGRQPPLKPIALPAWDGAPLPPGTPLLLRAEQGFGDTIQFLRFVPLADARGARPLLLVPPPLARLAAPFAELPQPGARIPRNALTLPLMSLPRVLGTSLASLPAPVAYLAPDLGTSLAWGRRLARRPGLQVGICWTGSPASGGPGLRRVDHVRSIPPQLLAPLAELPGIAWTSLARNPAEPLPAAFAALDPFPAITDFADTAALVARLDLVITVDTAVAHLAGALGRPAWLLNRWDPDWRWGLGRTDSAWYPTLRQFRQAARGDWAGPVAAAARDLAVLAAG